jgi:ABC-type multidrug transport system ATPase subunit/ABC-type multidrug transport system permease subunit
MALIGYLRPSQGRTLLNGDDLTQNYDRYRGAVGYVPQEDIIHRELTVYEALYYTAKLRLPPDTTDLEIDRRIVEVLTDLEMLDTRDVRIGTPERKGISGGQRKRVNLALELLTEPSLLCLDEPTSGLASEDALNVMRLLRWLADGGRTILLTVHQPSMQAYRLMDNVLYIAEGEQVYYGPAYPDSMLYFHPEVKPNTPEAERILADPGSCMREIMEAKRAGEPMETFAARYRQSRYHEEYVAERRKNRGAVRVTKSSERKPPRFSIRQWFTLCRRYFSIRLKDRIGILVLMVQAPIIAILLDLVFVSQTGGVMSRMQYMPYALFLLAVSAIWFGCSNAAREIVAEQAIYRRERMVNLSISAYVLSKFTVLGTLCLLQCVVLLAGTYFVLDFWGNPAFHLGILWLSSLAGVAMGLLLSALVRTTEASMATVPLLLIPQIILGGAIMPIDEMTTPVWGASNAVVSRWAFEGMLQTEHLSDAYEIAPEDLPKPLAPGLPAPPPPPNPLDRFLGQHETWLAVDYGVLGGFTFITIVGVGAALRLRERRR